MINLTPQERDRFAAYCLQESESAAGMAKQAENMPGTSIGPIVQKYKNEAVAFRLVGKYLTSGEEMSIG